VLAEIGEHEVVRDRRDRSLVVRRIDRPTQAIAGRKQSLLKLLLGSARRPAGPFSSVESSPFTGAVAVSFSGWIFAVLGHSQRE